MTVKIRVGLEIVPAEKLGFDKAKIVHKVQGYSISIITVVFERRGEPLVITYRGYAIEPLPLAAFAYAVTPHLDYPTRPFITALRMLEQQQEMFMKLVAETNTGTIVDKVCCRIEAYVNDVWGLLVFAAERRGALVVEKPELPEICRVDVEIDLKKLERAVKVAEEPAPSLGNKLYVEIAERALTLLKSAYRLARTVEPCGGSANALPRLKRQIIHRYARWAVLAEA